MIRLDWDVVAIIPGSALWGWVREQVQALSFGRKQQLPTRETADRILPHFAKEFYLASNRDVAAAGVDAWEHFLDYGYEEGRLPIRLSDSRTRQWLSSVAIDDPDISDQAKTCAAEFYFEERDFAAAILWVRSIKTRLGLRAIAIHLRSLIALDHVQDAVHVALAYAAAGQLKSSWIVDFSDIVVRIADKLMQRDHCRIALDFLHRVQGEGRAKELLALLQPLLVARSMRGLLEASAEKCNDYAYGAELRGEVELAIRGYRRAIDLAHPEAARIEAHIVELYGYQVIKLYEAGLIHTSWGLAHKRFGARPAHALSPYVEVAFVLVNIAKKLVEQNAPSEAKDVIRLALRFNLPPRIMLMAKLVVLEMQLAQGEEWSADPLVLGAAREVADSAVLNAGTEERAHVAELLAGMAYKSELASRLVTALELYRLALEVGPADEFQLRLYISSLGRELVKRLFEHGRIDEARRQVSTLRQEGTVEKLAEYPLSDVATYCKSSGGRIKILRPARAIGSPTLRFHGRQPVLAAQRGDLRANAEYFAVVRNCLAYSRSNIVFAGNTALYDLAAHARGDSLLFGDVNAIEVRPLIIAKRGNRLLVEHSAKAPKRLGSGIAMFGVQSHNYGHWMLEFLPRMLAFNHPRCPKLPIYVDSGLPGSLLESLRLLNAKGRKVLTLPKDAPCHFEALVVSAPPAFFPMDVRPGLPIYDTVWPADVFFELKEQLVKATRERGSLAAGPKRRLFISRGRNPSRRLENEEEIFQYLASIGFEIVQPENLSFVEQVKLFQSAAIVVGSCSSALSNAIFCDPGTPVIGLIHDYGAFNFHGYASFIEAGGARCLFVQGEGIFDDSLHPFHMNYTVMLADVKAAIGSLTALAIS